MKRNKAWRIFCCILIYSIIICPPAESLVTFNWIRLLKPYNNPPSSWDPRVSVDAQVVLDPENDGYSDNANRENFFHWSKNQGDFSVVEVYYHYAIPANIDIIAYHNTIQASIQTWQDIPTANIIVELKGEMNTDPTAVDGKNTVSFCFDGSVAGFTEEEVIGKTLLTWDSFDTQNPNGVYTDLLDCDIILNASVFDAGGQYTWSTTEMNYSLKIIDIQSVVTHEFGHALGIAHPFSGSSRPPASEIPIETCPTMFGLLQPAFVDNLNMRTLAQYDINCATFLYPDLSDGNDVWQAADPVYPGSYTGLSIPQGDIDWYVIFIDQYDTIKIVLLEPSTPNDLDMYLYYYDHTLGTITQSFSVYPGAQSRITSNYNGYNYQTIYAHTLMQAGNYYLKVIGKDATYSSAYTLNIYRSSDGDGQERSINRTTGIPAGDGIPDWWEVAHGLDPTNLNDTTMDSDNDGLSNMDEWLHGTHPNNSDTDADGMHDGWEVLNNLNPLVNDAHADPDNDGASNLVEFLMDTDPFNPLSVFYIKNIASVKTPPYESAVKITWAYESYMSYEILYSSTPFGPFVLMEEFAPGQIMGAGAQGPDYIDQGYPFVDQPDAGSIRTPPLLDNDRRYYKIRKK
ncbi:MAG: hypothetical protein RBU23_11330 [Candidatus Auribacterota bacterium]|nr:hypothetical protein [Candidatus Auribacterota bacterium]